MSKSDYKWTIFVCFVCVSRFRSNSASRPCACIHSSTGTSLESRITERNASICIHLQNRLFRSEINWNGLFHWKCLPPSPPPKKKQKQYLFPFLPPLSEYDCNICLITQIPCCLMKLRGFSSFDQFTPKHGNTKHLLLGCSTVLGSIWRKILTYFSTEMESALWQYTTIRRQNWI